MEKIGLIAGFGKLPIAFAKAAARKNISVVAVGIVGEANPELEKYVDSFYWISVGKLDDIIKTFTNEKIKEVVMAGAITKTVMFTGIEVDDRVMRILSSLEDRNDDSLLVAVANEIEREGIAVKDSTTYLGCLLPDEGCLTARQPTESEMADIRFGMKMAKCIGELNIGQTVVVKDLVVLAVEAIEGTDEAIRRGATLGGEGVVVAKVTKPKQDLRFDLPAVGVTTITIMAEVGASVLAVEAGKTIILEMEKVVDLANSSGISIVAM